MNDIDWDAPQPEPAEEALISAYVRIGRPVDELPYTPDMDRLVQELNRSDTDQTKHDIFRRLLRLRKQGRLPRVSHFRHAS